MNNALTVIDDAISKAAGQFVSTISQYKWDIIPDSQLQAAKQALTKNDYIMKTACADPEAVHDSLIKSAILGLDLTEGKRQGWLVPRKNAQGKTVVQLQVGYKGVEAIHQRMGVIDRLSIRVVHENDVFEWSGDDQEKPKHEANWFAKEDERGPIKGAFAVTYYPDGSINVTVTAISEIYEKHRDHSDSWKAYLRQKKAHETDPKANKAPFPPPWVTHEKAMIEKTMAYITSKQWPANIRDESASSKILETLHEIDMADYTERYTREQKQWFDAFMAEGDSLGLYLFARRVDIETYAALFNSFKKGEKTKQKDIARGMESEGQKIHQSILDNLGTDDMAVLENIEGLSSNTIALLKSTLSAEQKAHFEGILKPAA